MSRCSTCSTLTAADGSIAGCNRNGGCANGGCNKLNVFDWLSNMDLPAQDRFDVLEVRFKNGRKGFFRNKKRLELFPGDPVVVDMPSGYHIGHVALQGELVRLQMQKKKVNNDEEIRTIYRLASEQDLERFEKVKNREPPTLYRTREIIQEFRLEMKLTDVEFQADNTRATFYYSADTRVDFRALIKRLGAEFRIRIEMRQIGLRQEAGRLGGVGSCGRELCCSTWLSEFKNVHASAARYQNLSLNPSKLSGQCGRLKCCLNYELDTYLEALKGIPTLDEPLITRKGEAQLQKTDIFRKLMWFEYDNDNVWIAINTDRVAEIQALNEKGERPDTLLEGRRIEVDVLNSDLESLDKKYQKKQGANTRRKNRHATQQPLSKEQENRRRKRKSGSQKLDNHQ